LLALPLLAETRGRPSRLDICSGNLTLPWRPSLCVFSRVCALHTRAAENFCRHRKSIALSDSRQRFIKFSQTACAIARKSSALSEVFALIVLVEKWGAVELSMGLIRDKWVLTRSTVHKVPRLPPLRDVQFDAVFAAFRLDYVERQHQIILEEKFRAVCPRVLLRPVRNLRGRTPLMR